MKIRYQKKPGSLYGKSKELAVRFVGGEFAGISKANVARAHGVPPSSLRTAISMLKNP